MNDWKYTLLSFWQSFPIASNRLLLFEFIFPWNFLFKKCIVFPGYCGHMHVHMRICEHLSLWLPGSMLPMPMLAMPAPRIIIFHLQCVYYHLTVFFFKVDSSTYTTHVLRGRINDMPCLCFWLIISWLAIVAHQLYCWPPSCHPCISKCITGFLSCSTAFAIPSLSCLSHWMATCNWASQSHGPHTIFIICEIRLCLWHLHLGVPYPPVFVSVPYLLEHFVVN